MFAVSRAKTNVRNEFNQFLYSPSDGIFSRFISSYLNFLFLRELWNPSLEHSGSVSLGHLKTGVLLVSSRKMDQLMLEMSTLIQSWCNIYVPTKPLSQEITCKLNPEILTFSAAVIACSTNVFISTIFNFQFCLCHRSECAGSLGSTWKSRLSFGWNEWYGSNLCVDHVEIVHHSCRWREW